jgi:PKD repeat protein
MKSVAVFLISALVLSSCSKLPRPEFSYDPEKNPEAGDTIRFSNLTRNASAYEWDFGDGGFSSEPEPWHVYLNAGVFKVILNAINAEGSQPVTRPVTINEPTILGFIVLDSSESILIQGAEVRVYENENDRDSLSFTPYTGFTDSTGTVQFKNMEPMIYHIWVSRQEPGGFWIFSGFTFMLSQNKVNFYRVPCIWSEDQEWLTW